MCACLDMTEERYAPSSGSCLFDGGAVKKQPHTDSRVLIYCLRHAAPSYRGRNALARRRNNHWSGFHSISDSHWSISGRPAKTPGPGSTSSLGQESKTYVRNGGFPLGLWCRCRSGPYEVARQKAPMPAGTRASLGSLAGPSAGFQLDSSVFTRDFASG